MNGAHRFEPLDRDGWLTVWDRESERFIDHKATWDKAAATQVAAALNAHPYQADQWEWVT